VDSDENCDVGIGRNAIYLYSPGKVKKTVQTTKDGDHNPNRNEILHLLWQAPAFAPLNEHQLTTLSEKAVRHEYGKDEVIVRQGESGDSLFVLATGSLSVLYHDEQEGESEIASISDGACFGEMSLLTGAPRSATIQAKADSVVYEIKKEHLRPFMERSKEIVQALSELMAQRQLAGLHSNYYKSICETQGKELAQNFSNRILEFFGLRLSDQDLPD
jgi:branched-chain amino acid transport system substrate-binding protein